MVGQQEIRVLIVDDDEIDRQGVTRYVERMGLPYALRTAGSKADPALYGARRFSSQVKSAG
ncbi:MAG: response regulator [bacterium]|nr:response regulator [bacterium]